MKKVQLADFMEFSYLSSVNLSPDGRYAGFIRSVCDIGSNGYHSCLWLYDFKQGAARSLTFDGNEKVFQWDLDNQVLLIKTEETGSAVYQIHPETGQESLLFQLDIKAEQIDQIDNTKYLISAVTSVRPETVQSKDVLVLEELPFSANGLGYVSGMRKSLFIYDSECRSLEKITPAGFDTACYGLNRKDELLICSGQDYDSVKDIKGEISVYDLRNKQWTKILEKGSFRVSAIGFMNGRYFFSGTQGLNYNISENDCFYTIERDKSSIHQLAAPDLNTNGLGIVSDCRYGGGRQFKVLDNGIYFTATQDENSYLFFMDADGKQQRITDDPVCVDSFDVVDGRIIFIGQRPDLIQELYLLEGEAVGRLTEFNTDYFSHKELCNPEPFHYTNKEGIEVRGFVIKPAGYSPDKKYPAVLTIHGGPKTTFGSIYNHEMQMLAHSGYFVFYLNPRGSDGRGNGYGLLLGIYGTIDYEDIMGFTDHVLEAYPQIDKDILGVTGGSYGGYMTNWIVGHTNRFKAAVSQRSIGDWIVHQGICDSGYWVIPHMYPPSALAHFEKAWHQSPAKYAQDIRTPILFIHADEDYRCHLGEMAEVYMGALLNGTTAKICLFHGENHELSRSGKPANRIKRLEEIKGWFDHFLKGVGYYEHIS